MTVAQTSHASSTLRDLTPGLLLALLLAAAAIGLAEVPAIKTTLRVSALLIVILLGMGLKSVWTPPAAVDAGVRMAQRPVLRWGVAGLGFKLNLAELLAYGGAVLVVVVVSTLAATAFGWWIARRLHLDEKLGLLLGVGGGICGASAIVAADSVVQSEKSQAAYALGIITLLGTVGIVIYPVIARAVGMSDFVYGVWDGATLHEMAQVVAAGAGVSEPSKIIATAVKLARICLLAPIVIYLGWYVRRRFGAAGQAKVSIVPWFLVLFVVFAGVNSVLAGSASPDVVSRWAAANAWIQRVDLWVLCAGMAGVGLQAGFSDLRAAGARPIIVGALQWIFLAAIAYVLTIMLC